MSELIERNIIDEIDALVDEQLSGYHARSGYDYNVNQDRCWHCGEDWHGLRITVRMEEMRDAFWSGCRCDLCQQDSDGVDPDYSYATDDSEVLCPGSDFIGPWATKRQIERMRTARFLGDAPSNPWIQLRSPGDPLIESVEGPLYSLAALQQIRDATYAYAFPQRVVLGLDGSSSAEVRVREASRAIVDEGRPYRYGEDFSFAGPTIPPEMQFPREGPYAVSRLFNRMQHAINRLRDLGVLDEPLTVRRWLTGDPEPDTRTPQERALPRPSTTPPMWAVDAGRQRRTRTNSRGRH